MEPSGPGTHQTQDQLMSQILQVGGVFNKKATFAEEAKEASDDDSSSSDEEESKKQARTQRIEELAQDEKEREERKLRRLRKKPEQLRKQLFEVVLRKRIFLTDRMEKVEKVLIKFGIITE